MCENQNSQTTKGAVTGIAVWAANHRFELSMKITHCYALTRHFQGRDQSFHFANFHKEIFGHKSAKAQLI